jgi:hypothetical protein
MLEANQAVPAATGVTGARTGAVMLFCQGIAQISVHLFAMLVMIESFMNSVDRCR